MTKMTRGLKVCHNGLSLVAGDQTARNSLAECVETQLVNV